MEFLRLLRDLQLSIDLEDTASVRQILWKKGELLNHPNKSYVVEFLLSKATSCKNSKILDLFVIFFRNLNFFEFRKKINLEKHLKIALLKGNVPLTEILLIKGAKLKGREWKGESLACYVFGRKNIDTRKDLLTLLLKYGLDTRVRDRYKKNLLQQFVSERFVEKNDCDAVKIAEILIDSGISVNRVEKYGWPPLHRAIVIENTQLISYFIKRGADVNQKMTSKEGDFYFPLYLAVLANNIDIVDLLLINGADVNAREESSELTALHVACVNCNDKLIDLLLRKGADVSARTTRGLTPLSLLRPAKENYETCLIVIIKKLAKLCFENHSIHDKYNLEIGVKPSAREHFEKCTAELKEMANTKFHESVSFYCMLNRLTDEKEICNLALNENFPTEFEENLRKFPYYRNDLRMVLEEARNNLQNVESRLNSVSSDVLPCEVTTSLLKFSTVEDLSLNVFHAC